MDILTLVKTVVMLAVIGLTAAAVVILVIKEGKIAVKTARDVVIYNIWSGKPRSLGQGTKIIFPWWEKLLKEVTLENEPSDPDITQLVTAEGTGLGVDYVITKQLVINPVLAVTKISYDDRVKFITMRLRAFFQDEFSGRKMEDLFFKQDVNTVVNKQMMSGIEVAVNKSCEAIEIEWGIKVEIQLVNLIPPQKLAEVAEESATAEKEGERIKVKADKAGVEPIWIVIGDIINDAIRAFKGGGK